MQGNKSGNTQNYVNNIEYDEFDSRTYFEYGNGVSSSYIYNNATRRLQNLTTTATNGNLHDITYIYDPVGNITRISNSAGGADGLGGRFTYNYSYDDLYRLDSSDGNSAVNASYTLAMEYSPSGNILKKTLAATKQLLGNSTTDNYENVYSYSGAHKLEQVFEVNGLAPDRNFFFDPNGNMLYQEFFDPNSGPNNRYLCWDEENRLSATRDNNYVTANIYDASGNLAWTLRRGSAQALAGEMNWMWQNGSGFQGYGDLTLRRSSATGVFFQSELMTITDVGFTKHYFIAGQRIASKLGESLNNADVQPLRENHVAPLTENYKVLSIGAAERMRRDFECLGLDYNNFTPGEPVIRVLDELVGIGDANETNIIFYHSDHLGSSSFLTDGGGVATQHLQYMPFGEDLVHQQNTAAYYTPYTFSGKERDMETGLSYFGARYYDAGLSIWLSVDPLADHPNQVDKSPYAYAWNNPVKFIDPDGRCPECPEGVEGATYLSSGGATYNYSNGNWQRQGGDLPEVNIVSTRTGFYGVPGVNYSNNGETEHAGFTAGYRSPDGGPGLDANVTGFGLSTTATRSNDQIKLEAEVFGVKGAVKTNNSMLGGNITSSSGLAGEALSANAGIHASGNSSGVSLEANAGAYLLKGSASQSVSIFGFQVSISGTATAASAHIGGGVTATSKEFSVGGHFGIGFGLGASVSITY